MQAGSACFVLGVLEYGNNKRIVPDHRFLDTLVIIMSIIKITDPLIDAPICSPEDNVKYVE